MKGHESNSKYAKTQYCVPYHGVIHKVRSFRGGEGGYPLKRTLTNRGGGGTSIKRTFAFQKNYIKYIFVFSYFHPWYSQSGFTLSTIVFNFASNLLLLNFLQVQRSFTLLTNRWNMVILLRKMKFPAK